ncbi:amidase signature domain-containing protein [Naematelia encephala]|uniref:amidase n=1 Tax=Naematelia encephala TaxID=71784 RepID=A0A1Y2AJT2_9TREE|nr:amidase signature domain-containing protein [Naematelia encephala]
MLRLDKTGTVISTLSQSLTSVPMSRKEIVAPLWGGGTRIWVDTVYERCHSCSHCLLRSPNKPDKAVSRFTLTMVPGATNHPINESWETIAQNARKRLHNQFEHFVKQHWSAGSKYLLPYRPDHAISFEQIRNDFTEEELEMIALDATGIHQRVMDGKLTVWNSVMTHLKATVIAQYLTNCATDFPWERALQKAERQDLSIRQINGSLSEVGMGVFVGVPMSVKGHLHLFGSPSDAGAIEDWIVDESGQIKLQTTTHSAIQIFIDAGAIPIVKTGQPQMLMNLESENNIFGVVHNAWSWYHTAGGSSGGEGAIVALGAVKFGTGTDIGGSVRIPAAYNGIPGLKPTVGSIPKSGCANDNPGTYAVGGTPGPLCRSAADLETYMNVIAKAQAWTYDPSAYPLNMHFPGPFKGGDKPRIGVFMNDIAVRIHPAIKRGIDYMSNSLKARGYEVVILGDFLSPSMVLDARDDCSQAYYTDGGKFVTSRLDRTGEPKHPLLESIMSFAKDLSHTELWDLEIRRSQFKTEFMKRFNHSDIDVLMTPCAGTPAPPNMPELWHLMKQDPDKYQTPSESWINTILFNWADVPGYVGPTGLYANQNDQPPIRTEFYNDEDKDLHEAMIRMSFDGLPISIQLVGPRHDEARLMAAALSIWGRDPVPLAAPFDHDVRLGEAGREVVVTGS